jgi:hypothetical protein
MKTYEKLKNIYITTNAGWSPFTVVSGFWVLCDNIYECVCCYNRCRGTVLIWSWRILDLKGYYNGCHVNPVLKRPTIYSPHRSRVGETVVMGEQVALNILLQFPCNINFHLSRTAQTLVQSYQRLLTVILACAVVEAVEWNCLAISQSMNSTCIFTHRPDDGGSKDLWNVGKLLPAYTALQPIRQPSSYSRR